ncbi:cytochrome c5 family protein [Comamonas serinivorans]|uniref:Cytochrome c5 family protein n=1 Tax=Comamonas serinivorans TaxID=1082851 RepID=A0A1Y0EJS3_9BURK|nr:c-type cytochrome [Comamonas serinivorans]ARU03710.1 cytochrome c5 family protein [Comamonas serinivorans]
MSETPAVNEEAHTGPIHTPRQMLWASVFGFVLPVLIIVGLVAYVTSAPSPSSVERNEDAQVKARIAKVGEVKLGVDPALRPQLSGEEVYKAQCATCHAAGLAGAPKFGDAAAWSARLGQAFNVLVEHAVKGKGAMAPQGGGDFTDYEIARAVAYMANHAGGKFDEPKPPAAPASGAASGATASAAASAPATTPAPAAEAASVAASAPPAAAVTEPAAAAAPAAAVSADAGKKLYDQICVACHVAGVAGAPKLGDKAAWQPRLAQGVDALTAHVIAGKGAMPPRGGANASDAEIHAAVEYMVNASK